MCMPIPVMGRIGENTKMVYSPMVVISRQTINDAPGCILARIRNRLESKLLSFTVLKKNVAQFLI